MNSSPFCGTETLFEAPPKRQCQGHWGSQLDLYHVQRARSDILNTESETSMKKPLVGIQKVVVYTTPARVAPP